MDDIVGDITSPLPSAYQGLTGSPGGPILLLTNVIRLLFVAGGIFSFINILVAGFGFMTAGGDSKKITDAWNKIWQSLLGLVFIVGSFALAAVFGQILFGDATFILNPKIYGPGQ